jgi:hypothetical protein
MSTPSDLNLLLDMGFDKERAELAVKKTGGRMFAHISIIKVLADLANSPGCATVARGQPR